VLRVLSTMYPNIAKVQKCMTLNQVKGALGINDSSHCGQAAYAAIQAAPSFSNSFPHIFGSRVDVACLIPCGVDQVSPALGVRVCDQCRCAALRIG
jgi:tryptophanyl-tRNA synthetase